MSAIMKESNIVIVQSNNKPKNIVIICVNGDEATYKKLIKHKDGINYIKFKILTYVIQIKNILQKNIYL